MSIADKPTELSEQVLASVKTGQQAAIDAVRKFVDTVDQTRHDFLRSIVQSAGQTLRASAPPGQVASPSTASGFSSGHLDAGPGGS